MSRRPPGGKGSQDIIGTGNSSGKVWSGGVSQHCWPWKLQTVGYDGELVPRGTGRGEVSGWPFVSAKRFGPYFLGVGSH